MKVIKIANLWEKKDKDNNMIISGNLNKLSKIVIMPNPSKKKEKEPDYFLCIGSKKDKEES